MTNKNDSEFEAFLAAEKKPGEFQKIPKNNVEEMKRYFSDPLDQTQTVQAQTGNKMSQLEEQVREYFSLDQQIKLMLEAKESYRTNIIELMGREESLSFGDLAVFLETSTRTSVAWEKYVKAQMGDDGVAEAKKLHGTETEVKSLKVKKIGKR